MYTYRHSECNIKMNIMFQNTKKLLIICLSSFSLSGCIKSFEEKYIGIRDSQPDWQLQTFDEEKNTKLYRDKSINDSEAIFFARFKEERFGKEPFDAHKETIQIYVVNCQKQRLARIYTYEYENSKLDNQDYNTVFEHTFYNPIEKNSLERLFLSFEREDERYQIFCAGREDASKSRIINEFRPDYAYVNFEYKLYPMLSTRGSNYIKISDLLEMDLNKEINIVNTKYFFKALNVDAGVTSNDKKVALKCGQRKKALLSLHWRNLDYEFSPNPNQMLYRKGRVFETVEFISSDVDEDSWGDIRNHSIEDILCNPESLNELKKLHAKK